MTRSRLTLFVALALAATAVYLGTRPDAGQLDADQSTHFSIADTSKVTRIRIADAQGGVAVLERSSHPLGLWTLNGRHLARKDATDLLLKTFRRISVRQPVQPKAKEGVLKMMAASGKRVDIHLDGSEAPAKTWFIGTPTQSHTGTHMLLELPEKGRSSDPYITHMEGFTGFLSTRFFTSENEWRYTGVYESRPQDIQSIFGRPLNDAGRMATLEWNVDGSGLVAIADYERLALTPAEMHSWVRIRGCARSRGWD